MIFFNYTSPENNTTKNNNTKKTNNFFPFFPIPWTRNQAEGIGEKWRFFTVVFGSSSKKTVLAGSAEIGRGPSSFLPPLLLCFARASFSF